MVKRVLVANRGEIAIRIIKAAKQLGIETVLVCSSEDKEALPTKYADRVVCIGPAIAKRSYLNQESIIQTALSFRCDAIHPGYGFLSENESFAEKCEEQGIVFVGPNSETIRMMGDKVAARRFMMRNGIATVPGSPSEVRNVQEAINISEAVGYPILIKASSGGGGRGMRVAYSNNEVKDAYAEAKKEALISFESDDLYIEKKMEKVRHVEVQILGDDYGNIIHLGTRDCSLQRHHQKLMEEAPAYALTEKLRNEISEDAVRIAKLIGYKNAGTVEFIVDDKNNHYFIEVNTRIQVEHIVTEMISGVDIVKEQFRIASGETLSLVQSDVEFHGASIECRVNAEDVDNGFRPSPGVVKEAFFPQSEGVRVETYVQSGSTISPWYDSMIAKIVVHAVDRQEAINRMKTALGAVKIDGVKTNIPFLIGILNDKKYKIGDIDTEFLEHL